MRSERLFADSGNACHENGFFCFYGRSKNLLIIKSTNRKVLEDISKIHELQDLRANQFGAPAYRLYQALIQPVASHFNSGRLLIIPDADLYYLNFEVLISKPRESNFSKMHYLIRYYNISYLLSAASAIQFKNASPTAKINKALLFAQVFTDKMRNNYLKGLSGTFEDGATYRYLYRQPFALRAALQIRSYGQRSFC